MIYFAFFRGVMGSAYPWYSKSSVIRLVKDSEDQGNILTVFPMTRIRLLKVLRLKAGKDSTERTGHLGIVDLISNIHVSGYVGERTKSVSLTHRTIWHQLEFLVNPEIFERDKG